MCLDYSRRDKRLSVFMVEEAKDISDGYSWIDKVDVNSYKKKD